MEVIYSKDLTKDFIREILEIDKTAYPKDVQGTFKSVSDRFEANKDSYVIIKKGNEFVGYICFFPISEELYKAIFSEDYMYDDDIVPEQILEYECENHLFIISIVIKPEFRDTCAINILNKAFEAWIKNKESNGQKILDIIAYSITIDGIKWLKKKYFEEVKSFSDLEKLFVLERKFVKRLVNECGI